MNANISQQDLKKWADFILNHSLGGINPGDVVMIKGEHIAWPLMSVLQDEIFAAGAIADINMVAPENDRGRVWGASIAKFGTVEQIDRVPQWHRVRYKTMNKYIEILGAENPALVSSLPGKTAAALIRADEPFKNIRLSKKWVLTLFPTRAFAEMEGMTLEQYTDIIVKASTTDHRVLAEIEEPIGQLMGKSKMVRIQTQHPITGKLLELQMNISNRIAISGIGECNFPDGEVYTSPDANSVNGEVFFDLPIFNSGVTIQGIYLRIQNGIITDYKAEKEHEILKLIIETDDGSHRIGEVAFGMNRGLQVALKHPLFVEKVGGTMHIAIGNSCPECYVKDPSSEESKPLLEEYFKKGI
ncbi:MAG: aminopeptidase, partial [candidate division Zixibacteria bacterium]|nr:aminopeptidase [candidate division Zixibacteria bacterium]